MGWPIGALIETETQLQVLPLAKAFFLLPFPAFSVLLNSAGKLAWRDSVLVWGTRLQESCCVGH